MERKGNVKKGKTKIKIHDYLYLIRHFRQFFSLSVFIFIFVKCE